MAFETCFELGDFFFFLVYGSSDPNFCILEKKKLFLTFLFSPMLKTARFKKKIKMLN